MFEDTPDYNDDVFGKIQIQYTAGFATIPDDIKLSICLLVSSLYNKRKAEGVKSFTQGQITVAFKETEANPAFKQSIKKYKKADIYA